VLKSESGCHLAPDFSDAPQIMSRGNLLQIKDRLGDIQNAFKAGNRKAIVEIISVIINDNEATQQQLLLTARIAAKIGEVKLAIIVIDKFAAVKPDSFETQLSKGSLAKFIPSSERFITFEF
jgi:hypothetical protein